jgi:predicted nucleotidyltransferase
MSKNRKLESPVTLYAAIEREQHEALRSIAFSERRSLADVARDALNQYIERYKSKAQRVRRRATA